MKNLALLSMFLALPLAAQTINPNQIRPATSNNQVLTTVTANMPPTWEAAVSGLGPCSVDTYGNLTCPGAFISTATGKGYDALACGASTLNTGITLPTTYVGWAAPTSCAGQTTLFIPPATALSASALFLFPVPSSTTLGNESQGTPLYASTFGSFLAALTGCNTATYPWVPKDNQCEAPGGGGAFNGTVTYTSSQAASSGDNGKLVIMNCTAACAYTLPTSQPSTTWFAFLQSVGSTTATVVLGGSDTYNGTTTPPTLLSYDVIPIFANSAVTTAYQGGIPDAQGLNVTITPSAHNKSIAATGGGGGSTGIPFIPIQEDQEASGGAASFTLTFPQALQSSGATAFILMATDGSASITPPSGWTVDFNQVGSTYSRLLLVHKTSAGDTTAVWNSAGNPPWAYYFFELPGTRTLDQVSNSSSANANFVTLPAITPTAGALVIGAAGFTTNGYNANSLPWPSQFALPSMNPNWKVFGQVGAPASAGRMLTGFVGQFTATAVSTTPPQINIPQYTLYSGGGVAYATFSIK